MFLQLFVVALLAVASADDVKNSKRSVAGVGYPSWNSLPVHPWTSQFPWSSSPIVHDLLYPYPSVGKGVHLGFGVSTAHDVAAAVAAAKEATAAAALAHKRVQAAHEQVVIQERVAAAKQAAVQAAIQRSEAAAQVAAAIQKSEALAAAAAAVQKSAAASAASVSAAHAAGHFTSRPWSSPKPALNHWG